MLKKDNNFLQHGNKRPKGQSDNHKHITLNNKENINAKSVFEHEPDILQKERSGQKSNFGSVIVSPTFQSNNLVSLKGDVFKQPGSYAEFNINLRDVQEHSKGDIAGIPPNYFKEKIDSYELHQGLSVEQIKSRLIQHYRAQKYWKLLEKFFKQKDLKQFDVVLAWEDSITKHKAIKQKFQRSEQENHLFREQIHKLNEIVENLQKQINQDKNETRVISQKKCKGCEALQQKQKEYHQIYSQNKRMGKQIEELKEKEKQLLAYKKKYTKIEEKHHEEKFLRQELEKKRNTLKEDLDKANLKLLQITQNYTQLEKELIKMQSEKIVASKLHIQCEQLKQNKYQAEKNVNKMEQKFKKQQTQMAENYNQLAQAKQVCEETIVKLKAELSDARANNMRLQFEANNLKQELEGKTIEYEKINKEEKTKRKDYEEKLNQQKAKRKDYQEKLKKAEQLHEEFVNNNNKLEFELTNQKKMGQQKDEAINKYIKIIRDLQSKQKQCDSNQSRGKETQFYNLAKTKNPHAHSHNNSHSSSHGNLTFTPKVYFKIKEIYQEIKQITEELIQSVPRRRLREQCDDRDSVSSFQMEKYVNEIHSDFSDFINKFIYVQKENEILKEKLENIEQESETMIKQAKKEVNLKEQTLKAIIAFAPDDLKDYILDLLQAAECILMDQDSEEGQERFIELQTTVKNEGRDWKQSYQRMKFKFGKMEDDIRRLEDENEDLRRRGRGKEIKKTLPTDYEYGRDMVSRKDLRRKYNLDD